MGIQYPCPLLRPVTIIHLNISAQNIPKMEDPNLIATLIPVDLWELAKNVFCLPSNIARYLPPTKGIAEAPTILSREAIPARQELNENNYDSTHHIQMTFSQGVEC